MDSGQVELLVILGGNPVFTAPADCDFRSGCRRWRSSSITALYDDETSAYRHWNLPEAHALESWGDARAFDGTVTIAQPLIAPLYEGRTIVEVLASLIDAQTGKSGHDLVKDYWSRAHGGKVAGWTITDSTGSPVPDLRRLLERSLHDGFVTSRGPRAAGPRPESVPQTSIVAPRTSDVDPRTSSGGLEIIFRPDPTIWDGRFANNGWLQELPKPLTKITWDPTAWVSPRLAEQQRLETGDVVELRYRGKTARLPVAGRSWSSRQRGHGVLRVRARSERVASEHRRATWPRSSTSSSSARPMRNGSAAGSKSPRPAAATSWRRPRNTI